MSARSIVAALALAAACALPSSSPAAEPKSGKLFAHDVFFTLNDASPAARQKLVDACRKHLTGHPGTVFFAAGTRNEEMQREVNDRGFDVSLHVYFESLAAHDAYQEHPRHKQFIAENQANWKSVRVFDAWVEAAR
jgi:hypothetical protein